MKRRALASFLLAAFAVTGSDAATISRITNLYDAFGAPSDTLVKDWGFAALVEYDGKRILFDTGNHADTFERNVKALGVDLTRLDAVVISHRHGDHTSGLSYLLKVNPGVPIYVPQEGAFFKSGLPQDFLQRQPGLPVSLQYFEGKQPERWATGSPWEQANFRIVTKPTEILPGFHLLSTQSQKPGTVEMNELSLAIRTPRGLAVVVGCSHPGVEKILEHAARIDPQLYTVTGGFHLVRTPEPEIRRVGLLLRDTLKIERVAPAHCTSELGFAVLKEMFGARFDEAGLGATIPLPTR
ncbi:MAG TPA: MBL fold metallo-hydrolase [Steroidobacter sp.]|uniref:MBL fold metallo-hydrolase n=1 Tax=Steroidobacter sp. TaxID=1978227 RepID=UPI002ED92630